jgi:phosphopantothenoylcysteine decarboxylase/phosphopantothenate--cysteine ligase
MKLVLGVTGSIAAYKAYDICRSWLKEGHEVKVVLTKSAHHFCHKKMFKYLGVKEVFDHHSDFSLQSTTTDILHIELARWCDKLVIAPASANFIAKMAHGLCDDLLTTITSAIGEKPVIIYPAMNTKMLTNHVTDENMQKLHQQKNIFIHPTQSGELACGEFGEGKLPAVETVTEFALTFALPHASVRNVVITCGSTHSPLDPVRYLTNPASGKTGYELAKVFLANGHKVTVLIGDHNKKIFDHLLAHPQLKIITVTTTRDAQDKVKSLMDCDIYISAAAFNDILFAEENQKIKKDNFPEAIKIKQAPDILELVLQKKSRHTKVVGFAAETTHDVESFKNKISKKPVDLLVGNFVDNGTLSKAMKGFSQNENDYYFVTPTEIEKFDHLSKTQLASKLYERMFQ